jgi:hypothetical protein
MVLLSNFLKNNADMLDAADRCIELRQHLPSLVLMYSHIDTLAWAASKKSGTDVRLNFESWANRWLLPHLTVHAPDVTATDLYAARCGVLHTLTGKSGLSGKGHAREIAYAWGTGNVEVLREALNQAGRPGQIVALHYQELLRCLRSAVADFVASADQDNELAEALELADAKHYVNLPISRVDAE